MNEYITTVTEPKLEERIIINNISMYAKKILQYAISLSERFNEIAGFGENNIIPVILKKEDYEKIFGTNYNVFLTDIDKYRNELNNLSLTVMVFENTEFPESEVLESNYYKEYKKMNLSIESEPWVVEQRKSNTNKKRLDYEIKLVESVIWNKDAENIKDKIGTMIFLNSQVKYLEQKFPIVNWQLKYYFEEHQYYYKEGHGVLEESTSYKRTEHSIIQDYIKDDETKEKEHYKDFTRLKKGINLPDLSDEAIILLKYIFNNVDNLGETPIILKYSNELNSIFKCDTFYEYDYYGNEFSKKLNKICNIIEELKKAEIHIRVYEAPPYNPYVEYIEEQIKDISINIIGCIGGSYSNASMDEIVIQLNPVLLSEYEVLKALLDKINGEYINVLKREEEKIQELAKEKQEQYEREKKREIARKKYQEKKKAKEKNKTEINKEITNEELPW